MSFDIKMNTFDVQVTWSKSNCWFFVQMISAQYFSTLLIQLKVAKLRTVDAPRDEMIFIDAKVKGQGQIAGLCSNDIRSISFD